MASTKRRVRYLATRATAILVAGALVNVAVAFTLAWWQPPWSMHISMPPLQPSYSNGDVAAICARITVPESFPELLRRGGWRSRSGLGWQLEEWYGDSAMGYSLQLKAHSRIIRAGWPLPALRGEHLWVAVNGSEASRCPTSLLLRKPTNSDAEKFGDFNFVPLVPMPAGFAVDSAAWSALIASVVLIVGFLRRWRRRRAGRCLRCGYDLRGALEAGCPECGWGRVEAQSTM